MKTLIVLLLAISSAFASEYDATRALTEVLHVGYYTGTTEDGRYCAVSISREEGGVLASVIIDGVGEMSRVVKNGTHYRWQPGQRYFLSSEYFQNGRNRVEETFRTIAVDQFRQYVVIARRLVTTDRNEGEDARECIINLI